MKRSTFLLRLGIVLAVVLALLAAPWLPGVQEAFADFRQWIRELGPWGLVLLAVAYTPVCLLLLPGSLVTLGAGVLFPPLLAIIAVSLGSTVGAAIAFLLSRTVGRRRLEAWLQRRPWFGPLDRAVAEQGFRIVFLTRLTPVLPYSLLSYAFGLTRVGFGWYLLATWIGMLPGTAVYVYLGSAAKGVSALLSDLLAGRAAENLPQTIILIVGLTAAITVTTLLVRIARRALAESMAKQECVTLVDPGPADKTTLLQEERQ
jgi:uncharacterized membrane protein YdjX (TVP38/TMEM64 family)